MSQIKHFHLTSYIQLIPKCPISSSDPEKKFIFEAPQSHHRSLPQLPVFSSRVNVVQYNKTRHLQIKQNIEYITTLKYCFRCSTMYVLCFYLCPGISFLVLLLPRDLPVPTDPTPDHPSDGPVVTAIPTDVTRRISIVYPCDPTRIAINASNTP